MAMRVWKKIFVIATAGALLVALFECGTDPFVGRLYPPDAVQMYSGDFDYEFGCEGRCVDGQYAIVPPEHGFGDSTPCTSTATYWLCLNGEYDAFVCYDPTSAGWTYSGCGSATFDAGVDALTFEAGEDAGFDAGFDAGEDGFDAGEDAGFDAGEDAGFDADEPDAN